MRRYIVTGAPGAGKTSLLAALRQAGYPVVAEAATDLITEAQAGGGADPWQGSDFLDAIVARQRDRQVRPVPAGTAVQLFDRSPICTLALAWHMGFAVSPALAAEVARVVRERVYQPRVFLVHLLGFVTPTAVRRISYPDTVAFEQHHVRAYREYGYELVDVPAGPVRSRADLVDALIREWSTGPAVHCGPRPGPGGSLAG